ncbi:hypothetical protein [Tardiphaga sp. 42S5]|uniref:hypothetical protein n=1 Tax=Tardiphaga sp. 42S5 TaxID=1404799 RepID=UPI002A5A0A4A|nr:hypothetical protein [Tardiphaga sp. 42S5]WPO40628.1 hypothetical protein SFY93_24345 [Tardiphaga sp. 42S5]
MKVAFLVEDGEHASVILDGIFADCYSRWGGRFSLVVPCADNAISEVYWPWLERFGPDIVYSYVELSNARVLELHERLAPSAYLLHSLENLLRTDLFGFKPVYRFSPLSSLSLVFKLARYAPAAQSGAPIKVIDSWFTEQPSQLLTDNFGTYHNSTGGGMFPTDAAVAASLISVVSPGNSRNGIPPDLITLPNEIAMYEEFAARRASALSVMSAQFVPRLEFYMPKWNASLNVVLGETFGDRLLFWNARLLSQAWLDNDIGSLRVTSEALKDADFLNAFGTILRQRNRFGGNGHSNVTVRSISASQSQLEEAVEAIRSTKPWGHVGHEAIASVDEIVPTANVIKQASERSHTDTPFFQRTTWTEFSWSPPVAKPPTVIPEHLRDVPPQQSFAEGYWCADYSIEYDGVEGRYGANVWSLPTRWRMSEAFKHAHIGSTGPTGWAPRGWRSQGGFYSTYVSENRKVSTIEPPSALSAMQWALMLDGDLARTLIHPPSKVGRIEQSNEARYLIGVLGLVGGLNGAKRLLLHPFLIELFASFGGTTNLPAAKGVSTANRLRKRLQLQQNFDLREDRDREVLASLIVKASVELKKPIDYLGYEELHARWEGHRAAYWRAHPQAGEPDDAAEWDRAERAALDEALIELRSRQLIFQGHQWTCKRCHHKNWLDMSELAPALECKICKEEEASPLDLKWLFRPSQFLIESLRDHSVLSLLWTLSVLQGRSMQSFLFVEPMWFYFDRDAREPDAEADLLVVSDGKAVLCEVKASWSILRRNDISKLVELAKRLRPDIALLAVMDKGRELEAEISTAIDELKGVGIAFDLITLDGCPLGDNPYLH